MRTVAREGGQRSWLLALFALPFAGAGFGVLGFLVVWPLAEWRDMQGWDTVPARLLAAELIEHHDDSTTWRATARYRYSYAGNDYENDRVTLVGGSDNIGDFQQQLGRRLERALAAGETIDIHVNPRAPQESVISRELRIGQTVAIGIFGTLFALIGSVLLYAGLRRSDGDEPAIAVPAAAAMPWRTRPEWSSPEIRSGAGQGALMLWVFALLWCAISGVASMAILDGIRWQENPAVLFVLLFDAIGLALLAWAIHATLAARRFGEPVLRLDPHPGSIGGDVGGMLDLPVPHDGSRTFAVTLACVHVYARRSGKDRETRRDPVWSDTRHFLSEPTVDGNSRVHFLFAVPEGLPVSTPPSDDCHEWKIDVDCALPGVDLSRSFAIPVFATTTKSRLAPRVRESQLESLAHLESLMNLTQVPGGVTLDFPAGRSWRGGVGVLAFGALFAIVPLFMYYTDVPWFVGLLFGGIFGLVGLLCVAGGLWMIGNRLRVHIDRNEARVRNDLFGLRVSERTLPRSGLAGIVIVRAGSMTVGNKVTVFYDLQLKTVDGKTVRIGDGCRGFGEAERAAQSIATFTGLAFLGERDRKAEKAARRV
ncbi:MAG: DUF3592 domain-containing protein [Pseudomonadota bacterium]